MDWTKIMEDPRYKGKWVVLADDEKTVLYFADHAVEAKEIANKHGIGKPNLLKVPLEIKHPFCPTIFGETSKLVWD